MKLPSEGSRRSIRRQLLVPLAGLTLAVGALSALLASLAARHELEDDLHRRAELTAHLLNYAAEATARPGELQRLVAATGADADILEIVVVGGTPLHVIATTQGAWLLKDLKDLPAAEVGEDLQKAITTGTSHHHLNRRQHLFDFTLPIRVQDPAKPYGPAGPGAIMIHWDTRPTTASIGNLRKATIGMMFAASLLIGVVGYALINRVVLKPIAAIGAALSADGGRDPTDTETTSSGADELHRLERTLKTSLGRIKAGLEEKDTLLRTMEQLVRDNDALLSTVNTHAIVSVADRSGRIIEANDAFCRISGYSHEDLVGANHRIISSGVHPQEFWAHMWREISSGRMWRSEVCNRAKDGSLYWVDTLIAPFLGADGKPQKFVSVRLDITQSKAIRLDLIRAREAAEAGSRAKSSFLANMSHEIRTPLNGVLGMLQLLRRTRLTPGQHEYASRAEEAARSLLSLLNDILDVSKAEAGKLTLESLPFTFEELLRDLGTAFAPSMSGTATELLFDIDAHLPRGARGDVLRLRQVLLNLVGNAIKFTERGVVVLSIRVVSRSASTMSLEFAVRDTGIGIAPEHQAQIFDAFTQAESSTTRRFGGTGLGTSISRQLVALLGGALQLESVLGEGSRFSFCISLPTEPEATPEATTNTTRYIEAQSRTTSLRVLVVDDHPTAREVVGRICTGLGWAVDLADSGEAAVDLVHQRAQAGEPYDVCFVDWQMPGMNGRQTCDHIRSLSDRESAPALVILTAHNAELIAEEDRSGPAELDGVLTKPVTIQMVSELVATLRSGDSTPTAAAQVPVQAAERLSGLRVLVVEDNSINRRIAEELLEGEGAIVQTAHNGQEGVNAVLRSDPPFDVVVMDLQMPVMDGIAATQRIRQEPRWRDLPIVAMTANAMASDREACLAAGMNDHVGKPFHLPDLVRVLLTQSGRSAVEERPAGSPALPGAVVDIALGVGVDLKAAAGRLSGKMDVYRRMLAEFVRSLAPMRAQLQEQLGRADHTSTLRSLHTLRGTAATLGATRLAAAAGEGEQLLAKGGRTAERHAAVGRVIETIELAEAQIPRLLAALGAAQETDRAGSPTTPEGARTGTPPDRDAFVSTLRALSRQVANADLAATESLTELFRTAGGARTEELRRLESAIESMEFEEAGRICTLLADEGSE